MKAISTTGWKFRCKGEYAHWFELCRRDSCHSCDTGNSHATCDRSVTVEWLHHGGFSKSRPPHKACPSCSEIVGKRDARAAHLASLGWRERAKQREIYRLEDIGATRKR